MRKILFRGKRLDNKEWIQGYLWIGNDHSYITPNNVGISYYEKEQRIMAVAYEVDPETVCQYTNVPDKNGKKIFRGDIIKRKLFEGYIIGEVIWLDIGFCGFHLKCGNKFYPIGKDEDTGISGCDEVIGNIFDNPDLIE